MNRGLKLCILLSVLVGALALAACAPAPRRPAPVVERAPEIDKRTATRPTPGRADARPEFYTVKRGDTLFSIARENGIDYKDLLAWNGIAPSHRLAVGQQLRIRPAAPAAEPSDAVVVVPFQTAPAVEGKPLGVDGKPIAPELLPKLDTGSAPVKSQPKAARVPYSEQALAQLQSAPSPFIAVPGTGAAAGMKPGRTEPPMTEAPKLDGQTPPEVAKVEPKPEPQAGDNEDRVDWGWPAKGAVVNGFSESANLKGIAIAGKVGQPVLASAGGRVVYSGSGLRGYGKLVIIKHNKTYLSVYAHNNELLVKEGQTVSKGQKIAEMGNTDADQVKLHFEIRRLGKPVDPLKFLPGGTTS